MAVVSLVACVRVQTAYAQADPPRTIRQLIDDLSARDPAVRNAAREGLLAAGEDARPALEEASQSARPSVAETARALIGQLPLDRPGDSPAVRAFLRQVASTGAANPQSMTIALLRLPPADAAVAACRILQSDVATASAMNLPQTVQMKIDAEPKFARAMADTLEPMDPAKMRPQVLGFAARFALGDGRSDRALLMLDRLVRENAKRPAVDPDTLGWAYDLLCRVAVSKDRFDAAADYRRQQMVVAPGDGSPRAKLFALHAARGPLAGFGADMSRYLAAGGAGDAGDPRVLYCLSAFCRRLGAHAPAAVLQASAQANANGLSRAASRQGLPPDQTHLEIGQFLLDSRLNDAALVELRAALNAVGPRSPDGQANKVWHTTQLRLVTLFSLRGDYKQAGDAMAAGIEGPFTLTRTLGDGSSEIWPLDDARAEVHYNYLLAAKQKNDDAAANRELDAIFQLDLTDAQLFLNMLDEINRLHRNKDAEPAFEAVYRAELEQLKADPTNPRWKNDVAWLCARSGMRTAEAVELAEKAVAARPEVAAYLDTLGEAYYSDKQYARAAAAEKKAIALQPDDAFMASQLEKFEQAAANAKGAGEKGTGGKGVGGKGAGGNGTGGKGTGKTSATTPADADAAPAATRPAGQQSAPAQ